MPTIGGKSSPLREKQRAGVRSPQHLLGAGAKNNSKAVKSKSSYRWVKSKQGIIESKTLVGQITMSLITQISVFVDVGGIEIPAALPTPALRKIASRWRCCAILTMCNCHLSASDCLRPRALTPGLDDMRGSRGCAPCLDATGRCLRFRNRMVEAAHG